MAVFQAETGLQMPFKRPDQGFWWSNIREIYELAGRDVTAGEGLIRRAVVKMRAERLTVVGPQSIVNICRALAAEREPEEEAGRFGRPVVPATPEIAAEYAAMVAQYGRNETRSPWDIIG